MNNTPLKDQKCVPCEGGIPPLTRELAEPMMKDIHGWTLSEDTKQISRELEFKDFKEALAFINRVGDLAEAQGHHPDIHNFWNKVRLDLSTHAVKGLSNNDFVMAAKINEMSHQ